MSTVTKRYTPEDLLTMPDDGRRYELVNGELVEKAMSFKSDRVGCRISYKIEQFLEANPVGRATGEAYYQCFPDEPDKVRRPDASFVSFARLPADQPDPDGHCRVAPDLAVEVISPNDIFEEVDTKADEYLAAGVRMIWIVNPRNRTLQVRRPNARGTILGPDDELTGEDVLPGFRCRVADLFPSPRPAI